MMVVADWLLNMPVLMWCKSVRYREDMTSFHTYAPRVIPFRHLFHALPGPDPFAFPIRFPWTEPRHAATP